MNGPSSFVMVMMSVHMGIAFLLTIALAVTIGIRFRLSVPAAALGVGAFACSAVNLALWTVLPRVLPGDAWLTAMAVIPVLSEIGQVMLLVALLLAPVRTHPWERDGGAPPTGAQ